MITNDESITPTFKPLKLVPVCIAGSRTIGITNTTMDNYMAGVRFEVALRTGKGFKEVVSGKAPRGGDLIGELWAARVGLPVRPFPYAGEYGKRGGMVRNRRMAEYLKLWDGILVLIWDRKSPGSSNMKDEAKSRGILVLECPQNFLRIPATSA